MVDDGRAASLAYACGSDAEQVVHRTIGDVLRDAARRWPSRTALIDGDPDAAQSPRWNFADLLLVSENVARSLLSRFAPGDHVAIWAANGPEWVFIEFGAALAGVVLVTINPACLADELTFMLRQSRSSGIIVQDQYRGRDLGSTVGDVRANLDHLKEVIPLSTWGSFLDKAPPGELPDVQPDDVAQIQYTSGTTGVPKGARLTHVNLANNGRIYARTIGAGPDDVWLNPMPMFHTAGCGLATLGALQTGGAHVLSRRFDPDLILRLLEQEGGTLMLSVPTMLIRVLDRLERVERDISSWRLITLGGAPVPPELVRRAQAIGLKVAIGFGQTEASPYLTHTIPDDPHPDWLSTVGPPMPGTEIKIIDATTGSTKLVGETGEICARGYAVMKDYFDEPDATRKVLKDGWLHTGDLGSIDKHGYCRVQGRLKDMIIRGGENIYPREVEDILFNHEAVAGVAIVGVPEAQWGEAAVAFVQLKPGHDVDEHDLAAFCRSKLASYKVPRLWRFVDGFPETASGKIQKFVLRERFGKKSSQPASG